METRIQIPKGYEIDKENSTFECIKFKKIKYKLPSKWEDLKMIEGFYMDVETYIHRAGLHPRGLSSKSVYPTRELAEAGLALTQLLYLREVYNDGWVANWGDTNYKYCIGVFDNDITIIKRANTQFIMNFKTEELRNLFLKNFKDLLEIAKPLL